MVFSQNDLPEVAVYQIVFLGGGGEFTQKKRFQRISF